MKSKIGIIGFFVSLVFLAGKGGFAASWVEVHNTALQMPLAIAQKAVQENPDALDQWNMLGIGYLKNYRFDEAKGVFARVLSVEPHNVSAHWGMAEFLRSKHDYPASKEILDKIIRENPGFAPAYISLAYISYIERSFPDTLRWTAIVINLAPENIDFNSQIEAHGLYAAAKGMLAHFGGPLAKAANGTACLRHLNIAKKLDKDSPVVNFGFGNYYMLIPPVLGQDLDKAAEYFQKTIAAEPLFPDSYVRLAQIYKKKGDREKYEQYLQKALELDPLNELALDIKNEKCDFICLP